MNRKLVRTPRQLARKLMHREPQSPKYVAPRDFRRLGLPLGEARADWIRRALLRAIQTIATSPIGEFSVKLDRQVSLLVHSAYLLLDPRRRPDLMERVQLAYPLGREEAEVPTLEGKSLLAVPATWLGSTFECPRPKSHDQNGSTLAGDEDLTKKDQRSDSLQLVGWVDSVVDGAVSESLEESRAVVRLIREEVEEEKKEWFLPWRRWIGSGITGLIVLGALAGSWRREPENAGIADREIDQMAKTLPTFGDEAGASDRDRLATRRPLSDLSSPETKLIAKNSILGQSKEVVGTELDRLADSGSMSSTFEEPESSPSSTNKDFLSKVTVASEVQVWGEPSRMAIRQARMRLQRVLELMAQTVGPVLDQSQKLMELECLVGEAPEGSADKWVLYETLAKHTLRAKGLEAAIEVSDLMDSEFGIANWDLKVDLVERSSARAVSTADHRKNTLVALRLAKQASLELQSKHCDRLLRLANNIALRCNDSGMVLQVQQCRQEVLSRGLPSS